MRLFAVLINADLNSTLNLVLVYRHQDQNPCRNQKHQTVCQKQRMACQKLRQQNPKRRQMV